MKTVSKRDLNQHTATVLDQVEAAGDVVVTERGEPRWRISAFRDQDAPLARMEREGRYVAPAARPAPWPSSVGGPKYTDSEVETLLDELNGDH